MYLLEINTDGLIKDDVTNDNWKAIAEFRSLHDKHGIQGLTVVALTSDYLSPLAYYNENDRFIRSVEEVYGNRSKLKKDNFVVAAIEKYNKLQFNPDLEHNRILNEYKIRLIERIRVEMADESENGEKEVGRLNKVLREHENSSKDFYQKFDKNEIVNNNAITANGYTLSRIEKDLLTKKNSKFANEGRGLINPNKLNL